METCNFSTIVKLFEWYQEKSLRSFFIDSEGLFLDIHKMMGFTKFKII